VNINVVTIPHEQHRYETVGDWIVDNPNVPSFTVLVSEMGDPDFAFLVSIHEQVEAYLCWKRGIKQDNVDAFDKDYESKRPEGDFSEPGDSKDAPYYREHQFATKIERQVCEELDVDWEKYNTTVEEL
jgi:hypothetical protein